MKKLFVLLAMAAILAGGQAFALEACIPHITGGVDGWDDYLQADSTDSADAAFTLTLYSGGAVVLNHAFTVPAYGELLLDLKALAPAAQTGKVTYTNQALNFRLSYENDGGGIAEFNLVESLDENIGLFFSDFSPSIVSKGSAIANLTGAPVDVTLYALGDTNVLDTFETTVTAYGKILGVHSTWFPQVSFDQIKKIVVASSSPALCGLVICGDADLSHLLFTPAVPVPAFVYEGDPANDNGSTSESFYPITATAADGSNLNPRWTYRVNEGKPIEIEEEGMDLTMNFGDVEVEIDYGLLTRTAEFSATVSGDASGTANFQGTMEIEENASTTLVERQYVDFDMTLDIDGFSVGVQFYLDTVFTPSAEWFLDRDDLDTLPVGYVYDEQGTIQAICDGYVTITGFGTEEIDSVKATSVERWEIVDKLDSMTVASKTWKNIVKVARSTLIPDYSSPSGVASAEITYWVAKGIGMIKGIGEFEILGNPLPVELIDTNLD